MSEVRVHYLNQEPLPFRTCASDWRRGPASQADAAKPGTYVDPCGAPRKKNILKNSPAVFFRAILKIRKFTNTHKTLVEPPYFFCTSISS